MTGPASITAQEVFDISARHIIAQGYQRSGHEGGCTYLNENGTKCAVGCLFEPGEYRPSMEGHDVDMLNKEHKLPDRLVPHIDLLDHLQTAHDNTLIDGPLAWAEHMREIAEQHGLSPAALAPEGAS